MSTLFIQQLANHLAVDFALAKNGYSYKLEIIPYPMIPSRVSLSPIWTKQFQNPAMSNWGLINLI